MTTWAVLAAAGSGSRFGRPKHLVEVEGRPLWVWSHAALLAGGVEEVIVVGDVEGGITGGRRRQDSIAAGLAAVPPKVDRILVHDAARPLLDAGLVRRVIAALADAEAVIPVLPVTDTLKQVRNGVVVRGVDRTDAYVVQTPQGFRADVLREAHARVHDDVTDDASMIERIGGRVTTVAGDPRNIKVTFPQDLAIVEALHRRSDIRMGTGLDVHRFGGTGSLILGGVPIPGAPSLVGTSDADVVAHAVADALLGAAALGDLGNHFPSEDLRWSGADSMLILEEVVELVAAAGMQPSHVDVTIVVQNVRIAPHVGAMVERLAGVLSLSAGDVSVKATTTDEVGWIGAGEGLAALAAATLTRR